MLTEYAQTNCITQVTDHPPDGEDGDEPDVDSAQKFRIPNDARQIMRGRMNVTLHPSFNRKFRSPFTSRASWTIEECSRAIQCFLSMMFRSVRSGGQQVEVLQPELAKQGFGHLKRFAAFHFGHVECHTKLEYITAAKEAHQELLSYAH